MIELGSLYLYVKKLNPYPWRPINRSNDESPIMQIGDFIMPLYFKSDQRSRIDPSRMNMCQLYLLTNRGIIEEYEDNIDFRLEQGSLVKIA